MFRNNTANMILALILAIAMWLYVTGQVDPETDKRIADVKINFANLGALQDNGYDFADADTESVTVSVHGSRATVNRLDADDINVTCDLANCKKGDNVITLSAATSKKADVERIIPQTITVTVEKRVAESKDVKVRFTDLPDDGHEPGDISIYPETVEVRGAKSIVDKVSSVRADVDARKITSNYSTVAADIIAVDKDGKEVNGVKLDTDEVEVTAVMKMTETFSYSSSGLTKLDLADGLAADVQDKSISTKIKGSEYQIKNFKKSDLSLSLDLGGLKQGKHKVRIGYSTDKQIENIEIDPKEIEVEIGKDK